MRLVPAGRWMGDRGDGRMETLRNGEFRGKDDACLLCVGVLGEWSRGEKEEGREGGGEAKGKRWK